MSYLRTFLQIVFTAGILAGLCAAYFVAPLTGMVVLVCCLPLLFFAWPSQSVSGLQALMVLLTCISFVGTMMTSVWYPWIGVGIFGFLAATVKMEG